MNLELTVNSDRLNVIIVNSSDTHKLRLWEWHTSWGWFSLAFQLRGDSDQQVEIKRKSRDWTKNGPVYYTLKPQERQEISIDLHDGWWEVDKEKTVDSALTNLRNQVVWLRARLQIEPTPESDKFGVFTGAVYSDWAISRPPHKWMPVEG